MKTKKNVLKLRELWKCLIVNCVGADKCTIVFGEAESAQHIERQIKQKVKHKTLCHYKIKLSGDQRLECRKTEIFATVKRRKGLKNDLNEIGVVIAGAAVNI